MNIYSDERDFEEFKYNHIDTIDAISELLNVELPDKAEELWKSIKQVECKNGLLTLFISKVKKFLATERAAGMLDPKLAKRSVKDREVFVESNTADISSMLTRLENMKKDITERIQLGKTWLVWLRERSSNGIEEK